MERKGSITLEFLGPVLGDPASMRQALMDALRDWVTGRHYEREVIIADDPNGSGGEVGVSEKVLEWWHPRPGAPVVKPGHMMIWAPTGGWVEVDLAARTVVEEAPPVVGEFVDLAEVVDRQALQALFAPHLVLGVHGLPDCPGEDCEARRFAAHAEACERTLAALPEYPWGAPAGLLANAQDVVAEEVGSLLVALARSLAAAALAPPADDGGRGRVGLHIHGASAADTVDRHLCGVWLVTTADLRATRDGPGIGHQGERYDFEEVP